MRLCEKCGRNVGDSIDKCSCGGDTHEIDRDVYNALVYRIALKARNLADLKMPNLRDIESCADTAHARRMDTLGQSRGELIEAILCEEFLEEL